MRRIRIELLPIVLALLLAPSIFRDATHAQDSSQVWPTKEWQMSSPEEQGMDSAALAKLVDLGAYTGMDSLLVARHGKIVAEAYYAPFRPGIRHRMYSATKSVLGALIAINLKDGTLDSADHRVIDFFSDRQIANIDDYKKSITVQDLLNMTSGLDWTPGDSLSEMRRSPDWVQYILDLRMARRPGTKFQYNNGNPHLLSAILTRISGVSALDYARKRLFQPLGIADVGWNSDPQGNSDGGDGLYLQPRDMAKIGYLYLRNGIWDGDQIIPAGWIDKTTHASIDAHMRSAPDLRYGNLFWAIPDKKVYAAWGRHGQFIIVMPASDIVAVITGTQDRSLDNSADYVADCVKSDAPLPANSTAFSLLSSRVQDAATEKPSPVGDVPPIAKAISGKVYYFADNSLRLNSISLNLSDPNPSYEYQIKTAGSAGPLEGFGGPIGVDGFFQLGPPTPDGVSAAKGAWIDEKTFVGQIETLGGDDARKVVLTFEGTGVELSIEGPDGFITLLHGETKG
jgi:CubicO group peptidase (beta-lactamase class C family)